MTQPWRSRPSTSQRRIVRMPGPPDALARAPPGSGRATLPFPANELATVHLQAGRDDEGERGRGRGPICLVGAYRKGLKPPACAPIISALARSQRRRSERSGAPALGARGRRRFIYHCLLLRRRRGPGEPLGAAWRNDLTGAGGDLGCTADAAEERKRATAWSACRDDSGLMRAASGFASSRERLPAPFRRRGSGLPPATECVSWVGAA